MPHSTPEEGGDLLLVDAPGEALIADQAITLRRGGVDGEADGDLALVDLIHAENPGELAHHPGQVVVPQKMGALRSAS